MSFSVWYQLARSDKTPYSAQASFIDIEHDGTKIAKFKKMLKGEASSKLSNIDAEDLLVYESREAKDPLKVDILLSRDQYGVSASTPLYVTVPAGTIHHLLIYRQQAVYQINSSDYTDADTNITISSPYCGLRVICYINLSEIIC